VHFFLHSKAVRKRAKVAKRYIDAGVRAIVIDDDLARNECPLLSSRFYKKILFSCLKEEVSIIKEYAKENNKDVTVFFYSDGNVNSLVQNLVEVIEIDGLHPLECAAGMDISLIKKEYGGKLCLMGNIDTCYMLPREPLKKWKKR
jgi:uroporphyrinogen decarboxylase